VHEGYLGVRLRDDAVLNAVATTTPSISAGKLLVTAGGVVIKQEPMIDYRGPRS
jgi:hypothetical protein